MAEPFSALSVICNIFDLVERAYKGSKIIKEIYNAPNGQQVRHAQLEHTLDAMEEVWRKLKDGYPQTSILHSGVRFHEVISRNQEASNAMRSILDECRSKKPGSLSHALTTFTRSLLKQSKIEEQMVILDQCREALKFHITTRTHHEVGELTKTLSDAGDGQTRILDSLQKLLNELHDKKGRSLSLQSDELKRTSDRAVSRFNANRILQCLDASDTRYDEVTDASPHTYRWIHDDATEGNVLNTMNLPKEAVQAKTVLQSWLQSGDGIFHIAGKPGSGKSTLMKFIMKNNKTKKLLEQWAKSKNLVMVKFFFWKLGDWRQNTMRGLKQSVVAQVLKNVPELSRDLFPSIYQAEIGIDLLYKPVIETSDVERAFDYLLGSQHTLQSNQYKICLFLDGLDEFEELVESINHADLVEKIRDWVDKSAGHVKVCLSSRHLPAFDKIPATFRIKLQDITPGDIINFVKGSFHGDAHFEKLQSQDQDGCQHMIRELASRADGVFLWVSLVVKSIQRGLRNLDPLTKLRRRVDHASKELEHLLDQIILEIDKGVYCKEVYLLLAVALTEMGDQSSSRNIDQAVHEKSCPYISLLAAGCLFREMDSGLTVQSMSRQAIEGYEVEIYDTSALSISAIQISSRCLGLLEVVKSRSSSDQAVKFLHRSIPGRIKEHISKQLETHNISQTDVINTMAWMVLTELRYLRDGEGFSLTDSTFHGYKLLPRGRRIFPRITCLIYWLKEYSIRYQEKLENTTLQLLSSIDRSVLEDQYFAQRERISSEYRFRTADRSAVVSESFIPANTMILETTLEISCYYGLDQYVEWALAREPERSSNELSSTLLLFNACTGYARKLDCSRTLHILLQNGVSPNCNIKDFWGDVSAFDKLWCLVRGCSNNSFVHGHYERDDGSSPPSDFWSIIETFLAHGAYPKRSLLWRPRQKRWLRRMLEEDSQFDDIRLSNLLMKSEFFFYPTGRKVESLKVWTRPGAKRMKLFPSNRRLFMGVLDEHEDNPDSYIIITFQDVVRHVLPDNAERIFSLLEQKYPKQDTFPCEHHERGRLREHGQSRTQHHKLLHWRPSLIWSKHLPMPRRLFIRLTAISDLARCHVWNPQRLEKLR